MGCPKGGARIGPPTVLLVRQHVRWQLVAVAEAVLEAVAEVVLVALVELLAPLEGVKYIRAAAKGRYIHIGRVKKLHDDTLPQCCMFYGGLVVV